MMSILLISSVFIVLIVTVIILACRSHFIDKNIPSLCKSFFERNFKEKKWRSTISLSLTMIIFYILLLLFFLFFGDRVGWEGDDVDQLDGIVNFAYKGKDLVYRYYWQPLTYQLNLWFNSWLSSPKVLFIIPQIIGAANICVLLLAVYEFAQKRINLLLCFSFLIVLPEILFCSLYYNSTVFAMLPMAITLLFLFWQQSPLKSVDFWNNIRYFIIGVASTSAVFFRLDFLLVLPLLWTLMFWDYTLQNKLKKYSIYAITSLTLLGIFWLTDIFNPSKIIEITKSHEQGVGSFTVEQSFTNLFTITNLVIWIILIATGIYFVALSIRKNNKKLISLIISALILLYPIPTLTSPKYLIPGIIFIPFVLAKLFVILKDKLQKKQFRSLALGFIILSFFLQIVSIQWDFERSFVKITSRPHYTYTHDGARVSGAYLQGYNEVRKAQKISSHNPIKFARKMAKTIHDINKNVTVIFLNEESNISSEVWVLTFTTFYLELEGYQVNHYDRDNKIILSLGDKIVKIKKLNEQEYTNYSVENKEETKLLKVPYISREDPEQIKKLFEDFYNSLDKITSLP